MARNTLIRPTRSTCGPLSRCWASTPRSRYRRVHGGRRSPTWPLTSTSSIWGCSWTPGHRPWPRTGPPSALPCGSDPPFSGRRATTTVRGYAATVGELNDRRARKKAQTRELIRSVAQRMFDERGYEAVTIADIAHQSDVAVQTVFNHFATKEELFFDGRVGWVDGPAEAVRSRQPSEPPLTALRTYLVQLVAERVSSHVCPERRRAVATLEASDALRA